MKQSEYINNPDPWSYPRENLARHIGTMCRDTLFSRMAYLGSRRIGKTHFLLHDLSPYLIDKGLTPIYINMWGNKNAPQNEILCQLQSAYNELSKEGSVKRILNTEIEQMAIEAGFAKIGLKFAPRATTDKEMSNIKSLLNEIKKVCGRSKVVLILDEFQHLSTSPAFENLNYSLRTILDTLGSTITVLYTGSSRKGMRAAFHDKDAPFYQSAQVNEFPQIDDGFISHCVKRLEAAYNIHVNPMELMDFWRDTDKSPYWVINVIRDLVSKQNSLNQSILFIKEVIKIENNLDERLALLSNTEKAVLLLLESNHGIYSEAAMKFIEGVGGEATKSKAQSAKKTLMNSDVVSVLPNKDIIIEVTGLVSEIKAELGVHDVTALLQSEQK
ncbi:hypothetical protein N9R79_07090 [Vibrio sp.]|nr:hypothetical protein [Vibrio sp.]